MAIGSVSYGAPIRMASPLGGPDTYYGWDRPVAVDINGDGTDEIIIAPSDGMTGTNDRPDARPLTILMFNGTSLVDVSSSIVNVVPSVHLLRNFIVADFNGDGIDDVFLGTTGSEGQAPFFLGEQNHLLLSNGSGGYTNATANLPQLTDFTHGPAAADFDGDGDIDIFVNNLDEDDHTASYLLLNDGTGNFSAPLFTQGGDFRAPNFSAGFEVGAAYNATIMDFGADGAPDIYLASFTDYSVDPPVAAGAFARNDGQGNFTLVFDPTFGSPAPVAPLGDNSPEVMNSGDIDNDGDLDVVVWWWVNAPVLGSYFQLLRNDAAAGYTDVSGQVQGQEGGQLLEYAIGGPSFDLIDLDADGDLDIVKNAWTEGFSAKATFVFLNDGAGNFSRIASSEFPAEQAYVYADVNGDWIPDLVDAGSNFNLNPMRHFVGVQLAQINGSVDRAGWGTNDRIAGGNAADRLTGNGGNDSLNGNGGDDILVGGAGDDILEGRAGNDVAVYSGDRSSYQVSAQSNGTYRIVDLRAGSPDGADILWDVEQVGFVDGQFAVTDLVTLASWYTFGASTALVAATYQFFTNAIPTANGFEFLISSTANPNDLNDPYYEQFNTENRYINFASNLGTEGEGAAAFEAKFGALNFEETVKAVYLEVTGSALTGGALQFFLDGQDFYEAVAQSRVVRAGVDLAEGIKIVAIGSILNEAVKSGAGPYADAIEVLVADVAPDGLSPNLGEDLFAVA